MKIRPKSIAERHELNLRQGIKSSLSSIRSIIALVYTLYRSNNRKAIVEYSESTNGEQIKLHSILENRIKTFLGIDDLNSINNNPLFKSQMEALQVGIELIFKLGKVEFIDNTIASSAERTGGNRYKKRIRFGTNIQIIDIFLSSYEADLPMFLNKWLQNQKSEKREIDEGIKKMLTIFSEETQFKIRYNNQEISFQQEGIYQEFANGNTVVGRDEHENVGPFRVFKSYVKEGLHPYISENGDEFVAKNTTKDALEYYQIVSNALDLIPKRTQITTLVSSDTDTISAKSINTETRQIVYYGCPGSGKSYKVKEITNTIDANFVFRTTFHPDTDYASFVGCYKPKGNKIHKIEYSKQQLIEILTTMKDSDLNYPMHRFGVEYYFALEPLTRAERKEITLAAGFTDAYLVEMDKSIAAGKHIQHIDKENIISYEFSPQVLTNAYVKAWQDTEKPVYLIIEEINRGNCAQIFGDLFQLLDRDKTTGKSEYPIKADKDLVAHIEKELGVGHEGIKNGELCLPPNLIIYATMNTSDQSLFPMDSAFKRRWDWEYVPINYSKDIDSGKFIINIDGTEYLWVEFLEKVNEKIYDATNSEDKQMGNFFIKKNIDTKEFVNKVMFYLWNEVCKEEYGTQRNFFRREREGKTEFKFTDLFGTDQAAILNEFMTGLGVKSISKLETEETAAE
ncbi:AAA family ATPase [Bacteroides caecimuris]|uniref:AAA family ATPase n=1 Tax=Bacteroides caecimuris TaxID=1796613 RepID=UPI002584FEAC|nr:AAA family ATPase [Bacteroides caecimuris]